jgi:hypothetical protein
MRVPRKLTMAAAATITAVLAAGGIAMATPNPGPATGMMNGQVGHTPATAGPQGDWRGQMHGGDLDSMSGMQTEARGDGGMDAMRGQMGSTHDQMGAMHGDAEQMLTHHDQMVERDPQMQQRPDEMADRYPEMRDHMGSVGGPAGPRR